MFYYIPTFETMSDESQCYNQILTESNVKTQNLPIQFSNQASSLTVFAKQNWMLQRHTFISNFPLLLPNFQG